MGAAVENLIEIQREGLLGVKVVELGERGETMLSEPEVAELVNTALGSGQKLVQGLSASFGQTEQGNPSLVIRGTGLHASKGPISVNADTFEMTITETPEGASLSKIVVTNAGKEPEVYEAGKNDVSPLKV